MYKILIIALLLNFYAIYNVKSQWQVYNLPTPVNFNDVSVVNENIIWTCGDSAKVYYTVNGGLNWILANNGLPAIRMFRIFAIDTNYVWITSDTLIYKTTNHGTNWVRQFYSPVTFINKIHFFNLNTGYLFADNLVTSDTVNFFITRNGGLNWIKSVNLPVLPAGPYFIRDNGPNHVDSNFIYFFAELSNVGSSKFYKLTGGLNNYWEVFHVAQCQCDIAVFKNVSEGIAVDGNNINKTTNGGINWSFLNTNTMLGIRDVALVPQTNMVVFNTAVASRITYDFGVSLQPLRSFSILGFSDAKDSSSVWVAASNGKLLKYNITYIGINQISSEIPDRFILHQNYPNPFNPSTTIKFELPESGIITIRVHDVTGREVYKLSDFKSMGTYNFNFNSDKLSNGVYYYSAEFNGIRSVKKMILLK